MSDFEQSLYNGEAAQQEQPTVIDRMFNTANTAFGLNMIVQLAYGAQIYIWYPNWVNGSEMLFPAPVSGTCAHDRDWALGTKEVRAWSSTSFWLFLAYGWATIAWCANTFTDMEGGIIHEIFYRTTQGMAFVPFISTIFALNVKKSYAASQSRYAADIIANPTASASC
jgi:hypothetical protein